jgi:hypothetical protein
VNSNLPEAFVPNMALKFRTLDILLLKLPEDEKPTRYYYREAKTGIKHYYNADEVEDARNPRFPNQKRVWVDNHPKWVALEKEGEKAVEEGEKELEAKGEKAAEKGFLKNLLDKVAFFDIFKQIPIDVTDRDDPPNHTVLVYSSFPGPAAGLATKQASLQCISEVSVEGSGLAATKINDPPYCAKLKPTDPTTLAKYLNIQNMVQDAVHTGQVPSVSDMFNLVAGGPSK